MEIRAMTH